MIKREREKKRKSELKRELRRGDEREEMAEREMRTERKKESARRKEWKRDITNIFRARQVYKHICTSSRRVDWYIIRMTNIISYSPMVLTVL